MENKAKYNELLDLIEKRIKESIPDIEPTNVYDAFKYIMKAGGKRLRPVLTLISSGIINDDVESAIDAAVALEILHNFTLVHDDIMDNSQVRRNRPTVHIKWNEAVAILTGDIMIGYGYKLLSNYSKHARYSQILSTYTNELIEVCEGQVLDMNFNSSKNIIIDDYINMIDKKTARLFETSAIIGANVANANSEQINALANISKTFGLAFQIQDDWLDMISDQQTLGKEIGNDLLEGKKTFLVILAKNTVKEPKDIEFIDYYYNNNGLKKDEVPIMNEIFERNNIYTLTNKKIIELFDDTESFFDKLPDNFYKEMLYNMINDIKIRKF